MKKEEKLINQKIEFDDENFKIIAQESFSAFVEKAFHEELEIKYYYDDNSALAVGSDIFILKKGDITIANPYEVHSNLYLNGKEGRYCLLVIDLDFLAGMSREIDLRHLLVEQGKRFVNRIEGDERMAGVIMRISEEMAEKKIQYKTVVRGLVAELAVLLVRSYVNEESGEAETLTEDKKVKLIAPALSEIHINFSKKITVDMLSEICNISKFHFCRVFKEVTGLTAIQYINKYRIDVAEIMLKNGSASISDVAWQCGFDDESYFYRCFKRLKGIPPGKVIVH